MSKTDEKEGTQIQERKEQYPLSETWSQDAQDELEDFIEQQGIYIRQLGKFDTANRQIYLIIIRLARWKDHSFIICRYSRQPVPAIETLLVFRIVRLALTYMARILHRITESQWCFEWMEG